MKEYPCGSFCNYNIYNMRARFSGSRVCDAPHISFKSMETVQNTDRQVDPVPKRRLSPGVMSLRSAVLGITNLSVTIPDTYFSSSSFFLFTDLRESIDRHRYPQTCQDKP